MDDVIIVISRTPNGDDDGWWLGEHKGKTGLFPASYVEECNETEARSPSVEKNEDTNSLDDEESNDPTETIEKECASSSIAESSSCNRSSIKEEPTIQLKNSENKELKEMKDDSSILEKKDVDPDTDSDTENENNSSTESGDKKCAEENSDSDSSEEDTKIAAKLTEKATAIKKAAQE